MTLARWDPFREMNDLMNRFGKGWRRFPAPPKAGVGREILTRADWTPTVDIEESDSEYIIKVELPEVRKEDIKVAVDQGVLTIRGDRRMEREEKNKTYHRVERSYGSFARSFILPDDVKDDSITARHEDGMLYLRLAKSESARPRAVEIKVG
jgi:HSP20 family protein